MGTTNPLAAMFQSGPEGPQNVIDALREQQLGQASPNLNNAAAAAPQADPGLQAPTTVPNAPGDPLQQQIDSLTQQLTKNIAKLQEPAKIEVEKRVGDFNTFNEKSYQETYGGGGVLGTAGRALANLLSGATQKGKTIRDTLTAQNEAKWKQAIEAESQRVQLEKTQLAQATATQMQQLQLLKTQQQTEQWQRQNQLANRGLDIKQQIADQVKTKESSHAMSGAQLQEMFGDTMKDANGNDMKIDKGKYYTPIIDQNTSQIIGARATATPQSMRTNIGWVRDPKSSTGWSMAHVNGDGVILGTTPNLQPPSSYTGTSSSTMQWEKVQDADGNVSLMAVPKSTTSRPSNQVGESPVGRAPQAGEVTPYMKISAGFAPTATIKDTRAFAKVNLPHIQEAQDMIKTLDKNGELGPLMGRINDIVAGEIGSDPTEDAKFTQLRMATGLIKTALGRIHGGARGGGSITMMERFDKYLDSGHMDAATLKGALDEAKVWFDGYAHMGEDQAPKAMPLADFKKKHGIK